MIGIVIAIALQAPSPLIFITGNRLYEQCQGNRSPAEMACVAYITGVSDALADMGLGGRICISENVTVGQLKDVVVRFLRDHPETRDRSAAGLVAHALRDAFPCARR